MTISVKDIAWLAGIMEGEGSFGLTNSNRSPAIWLSMSDSDIVERVRLLIDSSKTISIHEDKRKESYKPMYRLTLNGTRAVGWMMTIYPLMGIRRKAEIRQVLDIWKVVELDKSQQRSQTSRNKQSLAFRLRRNGYSDSQIEIAKLLISGGLSETEILSRLEMLKTTGLH